MTLNGTGLNSSITRDHAFPASRGFRLSDFSGLNGVFCCYRCNSNKKHHDIVEWWHRLVEGGDPRAEHVWRVVAQFCRAGILVLPLARGTAEHWDALRQRLRVHPYSDLKTAAHTSTVVQNAATQTIS